MERRCGVSGILTILAGLLAIAAGGSWGIRSAHGQLQFEEAPISYHESTPTDAIAKLQAGIDSRETNLAWDDTHGYLPAVLEALGISPKSQTLVFSKTSFQLRRIHPRRPRAVYFNENAYIGWVQGGDVLEVASVDPQLGAVFYTLSQAQQSQPRFVRDKGECLSCHASSRTSGVPGHLVRSVFPDPSGQPHFGAGTFTTDHSSPFDERWGGWYVTGTHGKQRHMGNVIVPTADQTTSIDWGSGANVTDLSEYFEVSRYLSPHSDLVALLVMEHQTKGHNLITRAGFEARMATHYDATMNELFERPADHVSDSTRRRISSAADKLADYLLFTDECPLTDEVQGTSGFAEEFATLGPVDSQGRSLRQFDLQRRLLKYPCSYLVYSRAFQELPELVKRRVFERFDEVLTGRDTDARYAHLSADDRTAIREILRETCPEFAAAVDSVSRVADQTWR